MYWHGTCWDAIEHGVRTMREWILLLRVRDTGGSYSFTRVPQGIFATNICVFVYDIVVPPPQCHSEIRTLETNKYIYLLADSRVP